MSESTDPLRAENASLREILRDLVLEPVWREGRTKVPARYWCEWCDAELSGSATVSQFNDLASHQEECVWRRARTALGLGGEPLG